MKAILVAGLAFGDEGKGSIVDSLTRQTGAGLVVRYNGGAQAAHHVVTDDGREHCFSQFGAGTLAGAKTHLSRFMMIDPLNLINEARHLESIGIYKPFSLLTVDPDAPILTPYHRALNRLRELSRGSNRHGSCGLGIGELGADLAADRDVLTAWKLWHRGNFPEVLPTITLKRIQDQLIYQADELNLDTDAPLVRRLRAMLESPSTEWLETVYRLPVVLHDTEQALKNHDTIIFEGAQGVLLDEWHGFHPHTTYSNCAFDNAFAILNGVSAEIVKIGVTRAYMTRHGAGPLPTEEPALEIVGEHNTTVDWQGAFRLGRLDTVLLDYALQAIGGVDMIALTCVDHFNHWDVCIGYDSAHTPHFFPSHDLLRQEMMGHTIQHVITKYFATCQTVDELKTTLEQALSTPVGIISRGPTANAKEYVHELQPTS